MILIDPADPPSALPRGVRLGEFEIRRVLGAGGFGIVYLAFDHALEREVAIKEYMPVSMAGRTAALHVSLLSQSHAESFALGLRSFVNEARLLARFDHPSLVKVHRYWEHHNTAYMAMPFYAGHSLQRTRRYMVAPPAEPYVRSILEPLLGALAQLHREGVYHRDISPDNIIVAPDGRPVLLDFGAARRVLADMSVALTAILKPAYAPIEQYGETGAVKQGPWTDLYALGATLRHLLLGRAPAPATTRTVVDELEPLATQALPGCSPAFLQCIDWMLQPRPADRPQSVAALREALDACRPAPLTGPPAAGAADRWETTQLMDPAAGPAHQATMFDPSLAPSTVRIAPAPQVEQTQVLPRDAPTAEPRAATPGPQPVTAPPAGPPPAAATAPASAPAAASPAAPTPAPNTPADGRTEPTLYRCADDLAKAVAGPPALAPRVPGRRGARPWPLAAGGMGAAALLGLALWVGSRAPVPAEPPLAGLPAASAAALPATPWAAASATTGMAIAAASAAVPALLPVPVPAEAAPTALAAPPSTTLAPASPAVAQAKPLTLVPPPGRTSGPAAAPAGRATAPSVLANATVARAAPAGVDTGGRPGLATSITRLPAAEAPPPAGLPSPPAAAAAPLAGAGPAPSATPALPTPGPVAANPAQARLAAAAGGPAAGAAPPTGGNPAGPAAAVPSPAPMPNARPTAPAPAPARAADRDNEPVLLQARALSPGERCEGRVLVALWACVERQCKTDPGLRDHPECQKLRREP